MTETKKRILVVEDEQYLRELYLEILTDEGYLVDGAANGNEGYVKMRHGGYDLVLLDVMLPQIDGLEILKRLNQGPKPEKPNKKIVLLTNLSKDRTITQGVSLGVDGYLIKSDLTPGQILEKVAGYLK